MAQDSTRGFSNVLAYNPTIKQVPSGKEVSIFLGGQIVDSTFMEVNITEGGQPVANPSMNAMSVDSLSDSPSLTTINIMINRTDINAQRVDRILVELSLQNIILITRSFKIDVQTENQTNMDRPDFNERFNEVVAYIIARHGIRLDGFLNKLCEAMYTAHQRDIFDIMETITKSIPHLGGAHLGRIQKIMARGDAKVQDFVNSIPLEEGLTDLVAKTVLSQYYGMLDQYYITFRRVLANYLSSDILVADDTMIKNMVMLNLFKYTSMIITYGLPSHIRFNSFESNGFLGRKNNDAISAIFDEHRIDYEEYLKISLSGARQTTIRNDMQGTPIASIKTLYSIGNIKVTNLNLILANKVQNGSNLDNIIITRRTFEEFINNSQYDVADKVTAFSEAFFEFVEFNLANIQLHKLTISPISDNKASMDVVEIDQNLQILTQSKEDKETMQDQDMQESLEVKQMRNLWSKGLLSSDDFNTFLLELSSRPGSKAIALLMDNTSEDIGVSVTPDKQLIAMAYKSTINVPFIETHLGNFDSPPSIKIYDENHPVVIGINLVASKYIAFSNIDNIKQAILDSGEVIVDSGIDAMVVKYQGEFKEAFNKILISNDKVGFDPQFLYRNIENQIPYTIVQKQTDTSSPFALEINKDILTKQLIAEITKGAVDNDMDKLDTYLRTISIDTPKAFKDTYAFMFKLFEPDARMKKAYTDIDLLQSWNLDNTVSFGRSYGKGIIVEATPNTIELPYGDVGSGSVLLTDGISLDGADVVLTTMSTPDSFQNAGYILGLDMVSFPEKPHIVDNIYTYVDRAKTIMDVLKITALSNIYLLKINGNYVVNKLVDNYNKLVYGAKDNLDSTKMYIMGIGINVQKTKMTIQTVDSDMLRILNNDKITDTTHYNEGQVVVAFQKIFDKYKDDENKTDKIHKKLDQALNNTTENKVLLFKDDDDMIVYHLNPSSEVG